MVAADPGGVRGEPHGAVRVPAEHQAVHTQGVSLSRERTGQAVERKPSLRKRLKGIWLRNRDRWFRWLLAASVVIVIVTVLVLLSQLIFGDVPLFRLFEHSMDVVGTERLDGRG